MKTHLENTEGGTDTEAYKNIKAYLEQSAEAAAEVEANLDLANYTALEEKFKSIRSVQPWFRLLVL